MSTNCVGTYEQYVARLLKMKPNVYLHGQKVDRSNGKEGAERASYLANKTLRKVYKKVGFVAR